MTEQSPQLTLSGGARTIFIPELFSGRITRIDAPIRSFYDINLQSEKLIRIPRDFSGDFLQEPPDNFSDLNTNAMLGMLLFLSDHPLLTSIPSGLKELNLILGTFDLEGMKRVLYLEHEKPERVRMRPQFHLHERPEADYWKIVKNDRLYFHKKS